MSKWVSLYSVNGLSGGSTDWLGAVLPAFTSQTGIEVRYVEDHSRNIVELMRNASADTGADVIITLPPFMQMAAGEGLLQPFVPSAAQALRPSDRGPDGLYHLLVRDYPNLIYNKVLCNPAPDSYEDLLSERFRGKIQYSPPGWSGAGTAFMLQVIQAYGSKRDALQFFRDLQRNCLESSAHTAGLGEKVNAGDLLVANGDLQTNFAQRAENPNIGILFPRGPNGVRQAFELSYYVALGGRAPHPDHGKQLIDHLLSCDAQLLVSSRAQGLPARDDISPQDDNFKALSASLQDVRIWNPDWNSVTRGLDQDVAEYQATVFGK